PVPQCPRLVLERPVDDDLRMHVKELHEQRGAGSPERRDEERIQTGLERRPQLAPPATNVADRGALAAREHRLEGKAELRAEAQSLHRLHEEAFILTVVELEDPEEATRRLAIGTLLDSREARLEKKLLDEIVGEEHSRVAVPEHVEDELAAEASCVVVGHQK